MESLNVVTIAGKLTDDASMNEPGVACFAVRTYRVIRGGGGQKKKIPEDHIVLLYGADTISRYLVSGKYVIVNGRVIPPTDDEDGYIKADTVTFTQ